jgi:hypothetical protein
MHTPVRSPLALLLVATIFCSAGPSTGKFDGRVVTALGRSVAWLEQHPAEPPASIGNLGFDAWSWYPFSVWHPDPAVREHAGAETDRRLRALTPPPEWNLVTLSYWAVLLRIAQQRGIELPADPALPSGEQLRSLLGEEAPTTAYWTAELLRHAGIRTLPETSGTLLDRGPGSLPGYAPTVADAYAVFHELLPGTGLGSENLEITRAQADFVLASLPGWFEVCRAKPDIDCVAELLVVAALMDERGALYDENLDWLLSRQLPDGTYAVTNRGEADEFRHVVLVASWALLASLDTFETRVTVAE